MFKKVVMTVAFALTTTAATAEVNPVEVALFDLQNQIERLKDFASDTVDLVLEERAIVEEAVDAYNSRADANESNIITIAKTGAYGIKYGADFIEEWNDVAKTSEFVRPARESKLNEQTRSSIIRDVEDLVYEVEFLQNELEAAQEANNDITDAQERIAFLEEELEIANDDAADYKAEAIEANEALEEIESIVESFIDEAGDIDDFIAELQAKL